MPYANRIRSVQDKPARRRLATAAVLAARVLPGFLYGRMDRHAGRARKAAPARRAEVLFYRAAGTVRFPGA